jgi:hypothetical protein
VKAVIIIVFLIYSLIGFSQPQKKLNYRKFDDRLFHFGFMLGANQADFTSYPVLNAYEL